MKRTVLIWLFFVMSVVCSLAGCGIVNEQEAESDESANSFNMADTSIDCDVYEYDGHYYSVYSEQKTWADAELTCESLGGHLVTITSENENNFIVSLLKHCQAELNFLIGAIDENMDYNFAWVTGETMQYANYAVGEPNHYKGVQNVLRLYYATSSSIGMWDDIAETADSEGYICEWDNYSDIGVENYRYYTSAFIEDAEGLKKLNSSSKVYFLKVDIDLDGVDWTPIDSFTGVLLGNGHKISNLTIESVNDENIGLFSTLQGTVKDLIIEDAQITARGDTGKAGIVAGTNKGTISNVTVSGSIEPKYYDNVGGLVGYNDCGQIVDCANYATVSGADSVGGIVGYMLVNANNAIASCVNEGTIMGKNNVGGIAGYVTCPQQTSNPTYTISDNENKNTVTGDSSVGGIFGEVYGMDYYKSYEQYYGYFEMSVLTNTAEVTGSSTGNDVGGIVGKATRLTLLTTCENKADVTGGNCVGGFVGYAPDTNIKATGTTNNNTISGKYKVGGFAGQAGVIEYAINSGEIIAIGNSESGESFIGGIAGYCTGVVGCVNNIDIEISDAGNYIGGIAGYITVSSSNIINDNKNYGAISGKDYVGGIAGYVTCPKQTSNPTYIISDNENQNTVTGTNKVGGIFGEIYGMDYYKSYKQYYGYFEVVNCTNTAEIIGTSYVGGIVGAYTRLKTDSNIMDTNTTLHGDKLGQ